MSNQTLFSIEQLKKFMNINKPSRNLLFFQTGLEMPVEDYIHAFENWCLTGNNEINDWDIINELIEFVNRAKMMGGLVIDTDLQFISENMIEDFERILYTDSFWDIEKYFQFQYSTVTIEDCKKFVKRVKIKLPFVFNSELEKILLEERELKERKAELQRKEKENSKRISKGYIYVIKVGCKYKIGKTINHKSRLNSLQTSNPDQIKIEAIFYGKKYEILELELHKMFSKKRLTGEWFQLNNEDLKLISGFLIEKEMKIIECKTKYESESSANKRTHNKQEEK